VPATTRPGGGRACPSGQHLRSYPSTRRSNFVFFSFFLAKRTRGGSWHQSFDSVHTTVLLCLERRVRPSQHDQQPAASDPHLGRSTTTSTTRLRSARGCAQHRRARARSAPRGNIDAGDAGSHGVPRRCTRITRCTPTSRARQPFGIGFPAGPRAASGKRCVVAAAADTGAK
jgi:hypothetical protein